VDQINYFYTPPLGQSIARSNLKELFIVNGPKSLDYNRIVLMNTNKRLKPYSNTLCYHEMTKLSFKGIGLGTEATRHEATDFEYRDEATLCACEGDNEFGV
jgi:hypothetical protein